MFGIGKTVGSIVLVVVFLALAALTTFFYNSDQAKQAEIRDSNLFIKGKMVLETVLGVSDSLAGSGVGNNNGFGKKMADKVNTTVADIDWKDLTKKAQTINEGSEAPGFFSRLLTNLKEEWNKIKEARSYSDNNSETIFEVKN